MRYLSTFLLLAWPLHALAIDIDGQTDFAQTLNLNSSVSARVESVAVAPGEAVLAGSLLVKLVDTDYRARVEYAQARVDGLAPLVARMQTELEKAEELFDRDSLALVELQNAEQNHAIALADLLAAQAQLKKARYELSETEIRAPIDAIVLELGTGPGQFVNTRAGDPTLVTLVDARHMLARALLPAEYWGQDLLNRAATVSLGKRSFEGKVVVLGRRAITGNNNHPAVELQVRFRADGQVPANLPVKINIADN